MSAQDPHTDYGPAWDNPIGYQRRLEAQVSTLRAQVAALEAENDALLCRLCSAAVHDGRGGRLGLPSFWRAVGVR